MAAMAEAISKYVHPEEKQARLAGVERRQLWQWIEELAVTLLGITAFILLSFPRFTLHTNPLYRVEPVAAFPGLVSLLLLFMTVSLHKRWLLQKERRQVLRPGDPEQAPNEMAECAEPAATDPVTELLNGPAAEQWLGKEMTSARARKRPLTVVIVRMEEFDRVYRSGGNALCEKALATAGEQMRSAVRGSDLAAHLGHGEFVVALPGCSLPDSQRVVSRLGSVEAREGTQRVSLEFSSAGVDLQAGEGAREFIQRGRNLLRLYAEAGGDTEESATAYV